MDIDHAHLTTINGSFKIATRKKIKMYCIKINTEKTLNF